MSEVWEERKTEDGRLYYYNTQTQEQSWVKPEDAKTNEELLAQKWEERTASTGQIYYINKETNQVVWTIPPELQDYKNKLAAKLLQDKLLKDSSVRDNQDIEEAEEGQITDEFADKEAEKKHREDMKRIYIVRYI